MGRPVVVVGVGLIFIIGVLILLSSKQADNRTSSQPNVTTTNTSESSRCKMEEITPELVKKLGGTDIDDALVKKINHDTPYCKDTCLVDLENSKNDPKNWWTTKENVEICRKAGVILPKKYS